MSQLPPELLPPIDPVPPEVDAAPPPGFVPPRDPLPTATGEPIEARPIAGRSLVFHPAVLDWFPAGCFTLILLLTLFPWVGLYPGGHMAYSQGAWGASIGRFSTDSFAESVMRVQLELSKLISSNWVMMIYLLGLLVTVALSWADRALAPDRPMTLPRQMSFVESVWPHRYPILAGLAFGLFALLLIQTYAGFGLDTATERMVAAEFSRQAADPATPATSAATPAADPATPATSAATPATSAATAADQQTREIRQGMALGQYEVRTTFWLGLALGTHLVAVIAMGLRLWLYRRGSKPLPRVVWDC